MVFENIWNLERTTVEAEYCVKKASLFVLFANVRLSIKRKEPEGHAAQEGWEFFSGWYRVSVENLSEETTSKAGYK